MTGSRLFFAASTRLLRGLTRFLARTSCHEILDEPYLNLALSANANYLVTWDKDMLDLMQDEGFRTQHPQLTILNPVALLQALTPAPGQQS